MDSGPVIVSAYVKLERDVKDKPVEFYLQKGKTFIQRFAKFRKILFIDSALFSVFSEYADEQTRLIPTSLEDLYLYQYRKQLENVSVHTDNVEKDSVDYFMIQCHKTEWVKQAIASELFKADQYIWIDISIDNVLKESVNTSSLTHSYPNIRIGHIWNLHVNYKLDIHKEIAWFFTGGVFGGNRDTLIEFARITREKCLQLITEKAHLMWEVNIWYLLWKTRPDLFSPYHCDHDASIINGY